MKKMTPKEKLLASAVKEMEEVRDYLIMLPECEEWNMQELAELDDVRMAALRLAQEVENMPVNIGVRGRK